MGCRRTVPRSRAGSPRARSTSGCGGARRGARRISTLVARLEGAGRPRRPPRPAERAPPGAPAHSSGATGDGAAARRVDARVRRARTALSDRRRGRASARRASPRSWRCRRAIACACWSAAASRARARRRSGPGCRSSAPTSARATRAALLAEMGAWAPDIAQIVPELHEHLAGLPPAPALDPAHARFRVFDGVTSFLTAAARREPLLLVLDDLHWADRPSLLLLEFLARALQDTRLLVVGAYRDAEVRPAHPLLPALAELAREPVCERIVLGGLTPPDVARFIELHAGRRPSDAARHDRLANAARATRSSSPSWSACWPTTIAASRSARRRDVARHHSAGGARGHRPPPQPPLGGVQSHPRPRRRLRPRVRARAAGARQRQHGRAHARRPRRGRACRGRGGGARRRRPLHLLARPGARIAVRGARRDPPHPPAPAHRRGAGRASTPPIRRRTTTSSRITSSRPRWAATASRRRSTTPSAPPSTPSSRLAYEKAAEHYELALRGLCAGRPRRAAALPAATSRWAMRSRAPATSSAARTSFLQAAAIARQLGDADAFAAAALGFGGIVVGVGTVDETLVGAARGKPGRPGRARRARCARSVLARLATELYFAPDANRRAQLEPAGGRRWRGGSTTRRR